MEKNNNENLNEEKKAKTTNSKSNNKNVNTNKIEDELKKFEKIIQVVKLIFIVIVIGIFVWIIGKDLVEALGIVDIDSEKFNKSTYNEMIKDAMSN